MNVFNAINRLLSLLCICCACIGLAHSCLGQDAHKRNSDSSAKQLSLRYVSSPQVEIFAGPGGDFYPTAVLKSGQSVEVHQTAGEWLAITPPQGSFSWLPAAQGLLLPGGRVVEVTEKSAVSWIGSSLGTAKQYRWQVKLERGQQLAVIGEQTINDPVTNSKALWYKITPPAGEYRWIQAKATSEQPPTTAAATSVASTALEQDAESSDKVASSNESTDSTDSQVVPASAEQPANASASRGPNRSNAKNGKAHPKQHQHQQSVDRWANWHAMEFKDGSFSFPGLSRMLGMPPPAPSPSGPARAQYDPFDLTASYSRARTNKSPSPMLAADASQSGSSTDSQPDPSQSVARQSRGWRDPRTLREDRLRGRDQGLPDETALADNDSGSNNNSASGYADNDYSMRDDEAGDYASIDGEVMDAGYDEATEIGTSVMTAGATEPVRPRNRASASGNQSSNDRARNHSAASDQTWYGIDQAPASNSTRGSASVAQASLDDVQLELSAMVAGPESTWNLAPLADRARYFIEHGHDSIQRGQARLLLERIESFAQIARSSTALGIASPTNAPSAPLRALPASAASGSGIGVPASAASWIAGPRGVPGVASSTAPSNISGNNPTNPDNTSAEGSRFDATGWLVPVHSSGRDMPTHALTNDAGRIIVYVTPAPGVNLSRFESQAIGVYGLRGYLPQLKSNHVQIQRAVRLQ